MTDNAPVVIEFGPGATTCLGDYTGCAVCSTASTLLRYGKSIPRLSSGTPDMRTLGAYIGGLHRAADSRVRHGLSLRGICSPPNTGTNWCAYCAYLYLRKRGLPAGYARLSDAQIATHLRAGHSLIVPGLYGRVPIVARNSYSNISPALGRSDGNFSSWHMVAAHGVRMVGSVITKVVLADSDFGSSSRPVVPSHSEWTWATFLSYYHATGGWGITYINAKPPSTPPPPPTTYKASVHEGDFFRYLLNSDGVIVERETKHTGGFSATCTAAVSHHWPALHRTVPLVRLLSGSRKGWYIPAKYSNQ